MWNTLKVFFYFCLAVKTLAANAGVVGSNPTEGKNLVSHFTLLEWNVKNYFYKTNKNLKINRKKLFCLKWRYFIEIIYIYIYEYIYIILYIYMFRGRAIVLVRGKHSFNIKSCTAMASPKFRFGGTFSKNVLINRATKKSFLKLFWDNIKFDT